MTLQDSNFILTSDEVWTSPNSNATVDVIDGVDSLDAMSTTKKSMTLPEVEAHEKFFSALAEDRRRQIDGRHDPLPIPNPLEEIASGFDCDTKALAILSSELQHVIESLKLLRDIVDARAKGDYASQEKDNDPTRPN